MALVLWARPVSVLLGLQLRHQLPRCLPQVARASPFLGGDVLACDVLKPA